MNVLDWIIVAILILAALWGYRMGLVGMAVVAIGAIVGWFLAGQLSDDMSGLIGFGGGSAATVIAYAVIMAVVIAIGLAVWRSVRPVVTLVTLGLAGMVDRLGGLGLGLLVGLVVSGALIVVLALVAYGFRPPGGLPVDVDAVQGRLPEDEGTRNLARKSLEESAIVGGLIHVIEPLHRTVLGFSTPDINDPLARLKKKVTDQLPQAGGGRTYGTSR